MTLFIAFIFVYLPVYISVYRHPFYISMSSKAMLSVIPQAMCSKFPVVLHMDCTFKCNDNEFPILIIGITDACQQFHPLSISIISHHTEDMYEDCGSQMSGNDLLFLQISVELHNKENR
jgi:hypothetical protein